MRPPENDDAAWRGGASGRQKQEQDSADLITTLTAAKEGLRDSQRSSASRFENVYLRTESTKVPLFRDGIPTFDLRARRKVLQTVDVAGMVHGIWHAERERYGQGSREAPSITFSRLRRNAFRSRHGAYCPSTHVIILNPVQVSRGTILHELAHALASEKTRESHGPEFIGALIGLYMRHSDRAQCPVCQAGGDDDMPFGHWCPKELPQHAREFGLRCDECWMEGRP